MTRPICPPCLRHDRHDKLVLNRLSFIILRKDPTRPPTATRLAYSMKRQADSPSVVSNHPFHRDYPLPMTKRQRDQETRRLSCSPSKDGKTSPSPDGRGGQAVRATKRQRDPKTGRLSFRHDPASASTAMLLAYSTPRQANSPSVVSNHPFHRDYPLPMTKRQGDQETGRLSFRMIQLFHLPRLSTPND